MQSSTSPTSRSSTREVFVEDAYNEREHAILKFLREKSPDVEVTSFEQLAALTGLSLDETERTAKILVKRRRIYVVSVYDDQPLPLQFKATRIS